MSSTQYTGHMAHSCQPSAPEADIGGSGPSLKITTKQLVQKEQADCSVGLATKPLRARVGRGCVYSLLQDLAVGGLRVAEVHELIQQLINDNKIVSDALLLQLLKVLREDLGQGQRSRTKPRPRVTAQARNHRSELQTTGIGQASVSIPAVPVIPASASRLLPIHVGCWLSGCRQAPPFQWVARGLMKGPGLYTSTEAHRPLQVGKAGSGKCALAPQSNSTNQRWLSQAVRSGPAQKETTWRLFPKDNGFPCSIFYPCLRGAHPRGRGKDRKGFLTSRGT